MSSAGLSAGSQSPVNIIPLLISEVASVSGSNGVFGSNFQIFSSVLKGVSNFKLKFQTSRAALIAAG